MAATEPSGRRLARKQHTVVNGRLLWYNITLWYCSLIFSLGEAMSRVLKITLNSLIFMWISTASSASVIQAVESDAGSDLFYFSYPTLADLVLGPVDGTRTILNELGLPQTGISANFSTAGIAFNGSVDTTPIPLPSSLMLSLTAIGTFVLVGRRKRWVR